MGLHGNLYRDTVVADDYGRVVILPGASVRFYHPGDSTPYDRPLYAGPDDVDPITPPYKTGADGEIEVWGDEPVRLKMTVTAPGKNTVENLIDLEPDPAFTSVTDDDVARAITDHEARTDDPHAPADYVTQTEADLQYLPLAHEPGTDPHPQYLTQARADALYLPAGTYIPDAYTKAETDAKYEWLSRKGQPSGYAPLDPNSLIPTVHLPPLAITDTFVVATEAEMLALTAQTGDVCIRTDTGKSYILAGMPPSTLANWKELSAAAPVQSVDGRVGVVDLSDRYLSLTGGTLTGRLTVNSATNPAVVVNNSYVRMVGSGYALQAQQPGDFTTRLLIHTSGALWWGSGAGIDGDTILERSASGVLSLTGSLNPNANNFRDLGTSALRWRKLWGVDADLSGAVTVATKPLVVSPTAGNILSWDATGLLATPTTANVTVLNRQEFSPGAGSTSVTLSAAPNTVLQVARNGVEQSAALGHYSLAGATITFTDAFTAGEQVIVLSERGTSVPTDTYTKAESDSRFVNVAGDTMTGNLGIGTAVPSAWASGARVIQIGGLETLAYDGNGVATLSANVYNDNDDRAIQAGWFGAKLLFDVGTGQFRYANADPVAAGAYLLFNDRLRINQYGTMSLWANDASAVLAFGLAGGATDISLYRNAANDLRTNASFSPTTTNTRDLGASTNRWRKLWATDVDLTTALTFNNEATTKLSRTAAGALRVDTHLGVGVNPATWDATFTGIQAGQAGSLMAATGATGVRLASNNRVSGGGNLAVVTGGASVLIMDGPTTTLYNAASAAAGAPQTMTARATFGATGTLTLTPDAGQVAVASTGNLDLRATTAGAMTFGMTGSGSGGSVISLYNNQFYPTVDNAVSLGTNAFNRWTTVYAINGTISASSAEMKEAITPLDPAACAQAVLDTDWVAFTYLPPGPPVRADETPDEQWDEQQALHAKTLAETAHTRRQNGYVMGSPDHRVSDLFGLADRKSKVDGADLGVVACALQQALREIADLKARLGVN